MPTTGLLATRRLPPRLWLAALSLALAQLATGCVGIGTHNAVKDERDSLRERVRLLEASNVALSSERVTLLEGLEDLREEHSTLDRDARKLRTQSKELTQNLSAREQELARQNAEVARLQGTYQSLVTDLEDEVAAGQIEIQQLREGLTLNVSDDILFSSGSAKIEHQGRGVLLKVAKQLKKLSHRIRVEGHTDNVKIRGSLASRYPSNWELAGARAASVVRLFQESGIEGGRLSAVSFADNRPVAPNDDPRDRALNRRIEIRLEPAKPGRTGAAGAASEERGAAGGS